MTFQITYTTKTRPTDLPDGAEVVELPVLPFVLREDGLTLRVDTVDWEPGHPVRMNLSDSYASLTALLTPEDARGLIEALTEAAGLDKQGTTGPTVVRDPGGDYWVRRENGLFTIDWAYGDGSPNTPDWSTGWADYTLADIRNEFTDPITVIK